MAGLDQTSMTPFAVGMVLNANLAPLLIGEADIGRRGTGALPTPRAYRNSSLNSSGATGTSRRGPYSGSQLGC